MIVKQHKRVMPYDTAMEFIAKLPPEAHPMWEAVGGVGNVEVTWSAPVTAADLVNTSGPGWPE